MVAKALVTTAFSEMDLIFKFCPHWTMRNLPKSQSMHFRGSD